MAASPVSGTAECVGFGNGTTQTITAAAVPTQGNQHTLAILVNQNTFPSISFSDANWVQQHTFNGTAVSIGVFTRVVQSGDTTTALGTYTLGTSSESGYALVECTGANNSSPDGGGFAGNNATSSSNPSITSTPSVGNSLPLAVFGTIDSGRARFTPGGGLTTTLASYFLSNRMCSVLADGAATSSSFTATGTWGSTGSHNTSGVLFFVAPASSGTQYTESFAITGAGTVTLQNQIEKLLAITGAGTVALQNQINKAVFALTGLGVVGVLKTVLKPFALSGAGVVTSVRTITRVVTAALVGAGNVALQRGIAKVFPARVGTGLPVLVRQVQKTFGVVGAGVVNALTQLLAGVRLPPVNVVVTFLSKTSPTVAFLSKVASKTAYLTKAAIAAIFD